MMKSWIQMGRSWLGIALLCGLMVSSGCRSTPVPDTGGLMANRGGKEINSAEVLNFPDTAVGKSSQIILTLTNSREGAITLDKTPLLSKGASGDFMAAELSPNVLTGGQSVDLVLTFKPTAQGGRGTELMVKGRDEQDNELSFELVLQGNATVSSPSGSAMISLKAGQTTLANGGTIDFGGVVKDLPPLINVVIANSGTQDLKLTSPPSLSGVNASDFKIEEPGPATTIGAGKEVSFTLSCNPQSTGALTAALTFTTNDPDNATVSLTLTAIGQTTAAPILEVKATEVMQNNDMLDFGNSVVVSQSKRIDISIKNKGSKSLSLSGFQVNGSPAFTSTGSDKSLPVGESATIGVTFTPASTSQVNATLTFATNDPNHMTFAILLKGTGRIDPKISVAQNLIFEQTAKGVPFCDNNNFMVINNTAVGSNDLVISSITVNKPYYQFYAMPFSDCGKGEEFQASLGNFSVVAGTPLYIGVRYRSDAMNFEKVADAVITITSNSDNVPGTVTTVPIKNACAMEDPSYNFVAFRSALSNASCEGCHKQSASGCGTYSCTTGYMPSGLNSCPNGLDLCDYESVKSRLNIGKTGGIFHDMLTAGPTDQPEDDGKMRTHATNPDDLITAIDNWQDKGCGLE